MRRAPAVVAAALLLAGGVAGPSAALSARVLPGCEPGDGYQPGEECQVLVKDLVPACVNTVPQLPYAVTVEDEAGDAVPLTNLTVTWDNPGGQDVVLEGVPSTGTLVWPGTVVGADGTATDWPDWSQRADGTWARGDSFSWAVGAVDVTFSIGSTPVSTRTVAYPASAECAPEGAVLAENPTTPVRTTTTPSTPARSGGLSGVLAATGLEAETLAIGAGALVAGGAALVLVRRARRGGV